jgi:hypothetical protein
VSLEHWHKLCGAEDNDPYIPCPLAVLGTINSPPKQNMQKRQREKLANRFWLHLLWEESKMHFAAV